MGTGGAFGNAPPFPAPRKQQNRTRRGRGRRLSHTAPVRLGGGLWGLTGYAGTLYRLCGDALAF